MHAAQFGQYGSPTHTIAHLSDPHLLADGVRQYGVIDTEAGLQRALERLAHCDPGPDVLVFTGDLADRAEPRAYARLREIVEPAAADLGAQVVWTMGNHDERAPYAEGLFGAASHEPQDRVYDVRGLRVFALDTSVPGYHHGDLTDQQLSWLADVLATPAPHGTVLAMHHPPIPLPMLRAAEIIELLDQHKLAAVVEGTDVRSIIGGHYHLSSYSSFAGVPVSVASASCYTQDLNVPVGGTRGRDGALSFNLVHVYPNTVLHSVVPLGHYPTLDYVDAGESARRLAADGIRIPPAPRRELPTEPIRTLA